MLQKYNRYELLKIFLYNATESFRLRELSRLSKISPLSVTNYLRDFEKEKLIKKYEKREIPFYQANRDNENFKLYMKLSIVYELNSSGLVDFLWNKLAPEAIILFGSHAKGEAIESSDIDIFIIGKEKKEPDITKYKNKLKKHVHILIESDKSNMSSEFKNNLINGIILKGYLKLF
ncbi:TPA: nucleotidyltransferase domain-containing protein [Candidatus Woesearchaeota archaeon]|nr:nucleotidyltransferase domain-containing protein [Candidatus Woesearchaeota archaeon]